MADLENNINPTMDDSMEIQNSETPQNAEFNINLWDTPQVEWETSNLSELFSENVAEDAQSLNEEAPSSEVVEQPLESSGENMETWQEVEQPIIPEEAPQVNELQESEPVENNLQFAEKLNSTPEPEVSNNEVVLWKFENEVVNTVQETPVSTSLNDALYDHPAILDDSHIAELNAEEHQKAQAAQKAKLAQLIKGHEAKAHQKWLLTWVLSGILVTAWVFVLAWIFAKDQVIDVLNSISGTPSLSASVTDLDVNDEIDDNLLDDEFTDEYEDILSGDIEDMEIEDSNEYEVATDYYDQVDEILAAWYDTDTAVEYLNDILSEVMEAEEPDDTLTSYISQSILNLTVNSGDVSEEVSDEVSDEVSGEVTDESDEYSYEEDTSDTPWYTITHVESEAEANWVMPAHCSDLTCYGEDKAFSPCMQFRMVSTLDENAQRIGNNWACRYKDISELVYVEFN